MMIEKNIPMDTARHGSLRATYDALEVGDSFMVPADKLATARAYATTTAGKKFTVRKVEGGHRCWRTA